MERVYSADCRRICIRSRICLQDQKTRAVTTDGPRRGEDVSSSTGRLDAAFITFFITLLGIHHFKVIGFAFTRNESMKTPGSVIKINWGHPYFILAAWVRRVHERKQWHDDTIGAFSCLDTV